MIGHRVWTERPEGVHVRSGWAPPGCSGFVCGEGELHGILEVGWAACDRPVRGLDVAGGDAIVAKVGVAGEGGRDGTREPQVGVREGGRARGLRWVRRVLRGIGALVGRKARCGVRSKLC